MNRRGFLKFLPAAVGGLALAEAIPFNRVWSFPSKIVVPQKPLNFSREAFGLPSELGRCYGFDFAEEHDLTVESLFTIEQVNVMKEHLRTSPMVFRLVDSYVVPA